MPPEIDVDAVTAMIKRLIYNQRCEQREDLTQGAWLAVLEAAANWDDHPEWGPWPVTAHRVARWSVWRAFKQRRLSSLVQEDIILCRTTLKTDAHLDAETLLAKLPEQDHEMVLLYFRDGLTLDRIGLRVGTSGEAVRQRLLRSLERMRKAGR